MNLDQLGWCEFFADAFAIHAQSGLIPARVVIQHRGRYDLYSAHGELTAEISGHFRHNTIQASEFPTVGDWVAIEAHPVERKAVIEAVLPRRTRFSRVAAGNTTEEQVLAANIDDVFIVAGLADELNLRRIERYVTVAYESRAAPAILLTKADLCDDIPGAIASIQNSTSNVPVFAISSITSQGLDALRSHLNAGRTAVLLGPSGVGKSTLINCLCGEQIQAIQPVRESDGKGRHTTTRRELICLPSGGMIIDTPGLRELQLWDGEAGIDSAFADIESLAAQCRFADCQHETEPGCAVLGALETGLLDSARLESHRKLKREQAYFERRHDVRAQSEQRRRWKSVTRSLRVHKMPE